ncbi:hypothetical protein BDQ12DRAFT_753797 [Crucibulum laeve]|uniref:Uncharacterized protein n=1 Tax=Crucibulum laeve TaxID=68775 RepID=A0A5C3LVU2_9AGAR|nr:hypothetical protein BDQ12DRAFT_753797 [Crucibulum laeve]
MLSFRKMKYTALAMLKKIKFAKKPETKAHILNEHSIFLSRAEIALALVDEFGVLVYNTPRPSPLSTVWSNDSLLWTVDPVPPVPSLIFSTDNSSASDSKTSANPFPTTTAAHDHQFDTCMLSPGRFEEEESPWQDVSHEELGELPELRSVGVIHSANEESSRVDHVDECVAVVEECEPEPVIATVKEFTAIRRVVVVDERRARDWCEIEECAVIEEWI